MMVWKRTLRRFIETYTTKWHQIFHISPSTSDDQRRAKILSIFTTTILMTLTMNVLLVAIMHFVETVLQAPPSPFREWALSRTQINNLLINNVIMLTPIVAAHLLNRAGKLTWGSILFLTTVSVGILFGDFPKFMVEFGGLYFALPIIMAAFLVRPVASLILALLCIGSLLVMATIIEFPLNPVMVEGIIISALVAWLTAGITERAIASLRSSNQALTKRVVLEQTQWTLLRAVEEASGNNNRIATALCETLTRVLRVRALALWLLSDEQKMLFQIARGVSQTEVLAAAADPTRLAAGTHERLQHHVHCGGILWDLAVTFEADGEILGLLLINMDDCTDEELSFLITTANWLSTDLAKERQKSRMVRLLLEHENRLRRQTAADIHDGIITRQIRWLIRNIEAKTEPEILITGVEMLTQGLRHIIQSRLDPLGSHQQMLSAVEFHVFELNQRGSHIQLQINNEDRPKWNALGKETQIDLFFAFQEALENAVAAAPMAPIEIAFEVEGSCYSLIIADQGPGFDVARQRVQGRGLSHIQSRMLHCGGIADIQSTPGLGTTVRLRIHEIAQTVLNDRDILA